MFANTKLVSMTAMLVLASACDYDSDLPPQDLVAGEEITSEALPIAGGVAAAPNQLPWQVALLARSTGEFWCGGTILDKSWILTASQCVEGQAASFFRVAAGITKLSEIGTVGQVRNVEEIRSFPGYVVPFSGKDIALVRLSSPLDLTSPAVQAIDIVGPDTLELAAPRTGSIASGWGATGPGSGEPSDTLQGIYLESVDTASAQSWYNFYFSLYFPNTPAPTIGADQIVAGRPFNIMAHTCAGDAGGPLVVEAPDQSYLLAGVTSWGIGCGDVSLPPIFTRVSWYADWIEEVINPPTSGLVLDETNLSLSGDQWLHYAITVPSGVARMVATSSGGTGDADLYTRASKMPTTSAYACRPYLAGSDESCTHTSPAAGTWYVSLRPYNNQSFSGANLTVRFE